MTEMADMHGKLKSFNHSPWGGGGGDANGGGTITSHTDEYDQKLCNACRHGQIEKARDALNNGANPSVQFRLALGEITPIFLCASKGHIEIAKLLIQYNANINKRMDFDGTICLHHASSNGQFKMCEFLIENGCNVNSRDKLGRTPLMDACEIGNLNVIDILIKNGADIDCEDKERHTALSYCIDFINLGSSNGNSEDNKFYEAGWRLVANGANPNYGGKFVNRTLLHCAAAQGDMDGCKNLVEKYEATIAVRDNDDKTPIDYAMDNKYDDVANYLNEKIQQGGGCCTIL